MITVDVDLDVRVGDVGHHLRMGAKRVVALVKSIHRHFPVAIPLHSLRFNLCVTMPRVSGQMLGQNTEILQ